MQEIENILALKELKRRGWLLRGIKDCESVADHSYSAAALCLIFCPPNLNREKVLSIAIIHDLAEPIIGDITPYDNVPAEAKLEKERKAMRSVTGDKGLLKLFDEYIDQSSPEARFVLLMDKLDMCLQAKRYCSQGRLSRKELEEFFIKPSLPFLKGSGFEKLLTSRSPRQ